MLIKAVFLSTDFADFHRLKQDYAFEFSEKNSFKKSV